MFEVVRVGDRGSSVSNTSQIWGFMLVYSSTLASHVSYCLGVAAQPVFPKSSHTSGDVFQGIEICQPTSLCIM